MSSAADNSLAVAVTVGAVSRRGRPRRQYKCQHCARTFKRSEHCIRHERTHTHEKPFACRYCHKSYSRKDQVTRHERTLHSYDQEQRQGQEQNSNGEYIADQVNVACAPSTRPAVPETPPRDFDEPEADQNFAGQGGPANELTQRNLPSPRDEAGFSPSSSSAASSSNSATVFSGRHPSEPCTCSGAAWSGKMLATTTHSTAQRKTPSTAVNTLTNTQPQFASTHDNYDPSYASPNFTTIYPTARRHNDVATDPDFLPTSMALDDDEIPLAQADNGTVSPHRQQDQHREQDQHRPRPPGPLDQDTAPFFFSPMPDVDQDLTGFTFPPLSGHIMDLGYNQHNPQIADDFRLPPLTIANFETMSNFAHPESQTTQTIPDFGAAENRTSHLDTARPRAIHDIPLLLQDKRRPQPVLAVDETAYLSIRSDLMQRLMLSDHEIDIPPAKACQGFLSSYIANFHGHQPIIHLQTLCPKTVPSPLILAMCSIGALYRLDRRRSRKLYDTALRAVRNIASSLQVDDKALVKDYPLWYVQARILLTFYATMSGDKDLFLRTMQENGFYTVAFNKVRISLAGHKTSLSRMIWRDWVEYESWKRALGGIFVASTLTMVIFDINPGFNASQDLEFEAFHDEALWDAESSNAWRELRTNIVKQQQDGGRRTFKEVFIDVMLEGKYHSKGSPYQVSAFSALVLMNAVVVHMWQRLQVSQAFAGPGCDSPFSGGGHDQLDRSLRDNAMKLLLRCDAFLRSGESDAGQPDTDEATESSLVFNSQAILRIAYIRLFKPASPSNRINLISLDPMEMEASITSFATAEVERTEPLLDAVVQAFEGLRIPVKLGHLLVRKTAAFRWGVEHAVAGWESALLVTKWVHSVEISTLSDVQPSPRERELLTRIKEVLQEAEYDLSESVSLAAGVARTWGWFLQDVWIWGITPRMGSALGLLAKAYERVRKANGRPSLDAGP